MREEIEARPSATVLIGLILGLIAFNFPICLLFLLAFLIWIRPMPAKTLLAGAFVLGLGLSPVSIPGIVQGTPIDGIGTVSTVPTLSPDGQSCEFEFRGGSLFLTLPLNPGVMLGDRLRISGIAKPLQSNVGGWSHQRTIGRIQVDRFQLVESGSWVAHFADGWRRSFMEFLNANLSPKDASLVDAICFNARSMIDKQTKEEMGHSGVIHIVSASGLQVFVFGGLIAMLLRFVPLPRWLQILVLAIVLVIYALAAGLQPQIVRAVVMTILGLSAYLFRREPDPLSALSIGGICYLIWRPEAVYSLAFQLSFITVAAVALFFRRSPETHASPRSQIARHITDFLKLSGVVSMATMPMVAYTLGVVSLVAVFANLLVYWCLPFLVAIAFSAHATSLVLPQMGGAIASIFLTPISHFIYTVLGWLGDESTSLQAPAFSAYWLVALYGAWAMTYRRRVVQP